MLSKYSNGSSSCRLIATLVRFSFVMVYVKVRLVEAQEPANLQLILGNLASPIQSDGKIAAYDREDTELSYGYNVQPDIVERDLLASGAASLEPEKSQYLATLKRFLGQEMNEYRSEVRVQDLLARINNSREEGSLFGQEQYQEEPGNSRPGLQSATTTARPAYNQIPRPLVFK